MPPSSPRRLELKPGPKRLPTTPLGPVVQLYRELFGSHEGQDNLSLGHLKTRKDMGLTVYLYSLNIVLCLHGFHEKDDRFRLVPVHKRNTTWINFLEVKASILYDK